MKQVRMIKPWQRGSVSNPEPLLVGAIYEFEDEYAAHLIAEGVAVEVAFGWIRQAEDVRDWTLKPEVVEAAKATLPTSWDLRSTGFMPPVVDQGSLGSCTANAGAGVFDYMEKKQGGQFLPGSRLFLYYNTRVKVEHSPAGQDTGCTIRGTMQSLVTYGICKEATDPYIISRFSVAPTVVMLAEGLDYQVLFYALLDPTGSTTAQILANIKTMVASGYPVEFGFDVYASFLTIGSNGLMPYPAVGESYKGGHATVIVGYDDNKQCPNASKGAFLVRNSWGASWGLAGYFWMPYDILTKPFNGRRMASDFWAAGKVESGLQMVNRGVA